MIDQKGNDAGIVPGTAAGKEPGRVSTSALSVTLALQEGLAATALAMEDFAAAARHCEQLVQVRPDHFEAWFNLGYSRHRQGQHDAAAAAYQQAFRVRSNDPRPLVNLGMVRQALGDTDGARQAYEGAVALDPDQPQALWNLGLLAEQDEKWDTAERLYAKLASLESPDQPSSQLENSKPWLRLALARLRQGNHGGALEALDVCHSQSPGSIDAWSCRGLALLELERWDEAKICFARVLELNPTRPDALRGLAALAIRDADCSTAIQLRRRLGEQRHSLPELTYNIARMLHEAGSLDEALRYYSEALKERPRFAEALLNLGHVLHNLGRGEEATECWKRALGLNSNFAAAYFESRR